MPKSLAAVAVALLAVIALEGGILIMRPAPDAASFPDTFRVSGPANIRQDPLPVVTNDKDYSEVLNAICLFDAAIYNNTVVRNSQFESPTSTPEAPAMVFGPAACP